MPPPNVSSQSQAIPEPNLPHTPPLWTHAPQGRPGQQYGYWTAGEAVARDQKNLFRGWLQLSGLQGPRVFMCQRGVLTRGWGYI